MEKYQEIVYKTKTNDVDEKGIVTVAVNGINVVDSQNDISMPGSFNKTLKENIKRMKWLYNHDTTQLLGVPLEGKEIDENLVMVGQLNMHKQLCLDVLADYKLFAETGRTLEHSIGVSAVKRDKDDPRKVKEWKMWEYSTLSSWGANPRTFLVGIKNDNPMNVKKHIDYLKDALTGKFGHTDELLKKYDMALTEILKALNGEQEQKMVTCPCCGKEFDYNSREQHTFEKRVLDTCSMYQGWIIDGIVEEEMSKLEPSIRESVMALMNGIASKGGIITDMTQKGIEDFSNYVYCPNCYSRVYSAQTIQKSEQKGEPLNDTHPEQKKEAVEDTFFSQLNQIF